MSILNAVTTRRRRRRSPSLLGRFGAISLIVMVALGGVVAHVLKDGIRSQALAAARAQASLVAATAGRVPVSPEELAAGLSDATISRLDGTLPGAGSGSDLSRVKIWRADGTVVFADDHRIIGQHFDQPELAGIMAGHAKSDVSNATDAENQLERGAGRLLEVYTPLRFGASNSVSAVFEIYLPYEPIAHTISAQTTRLYLALGLGLAVLWLLLFRLVAGASRTLRRSAEHNRHQATHDSLTGLANRALLREQLVLLTAASAPFGLALVDLDRFKDINDSIGHRSGDDALRQVAVRLASAAASEATVARLGGDEFAIVMPGIASRDRACEEALGLVHALEVPVSVAGLEMEIAASVGVVTFPADGADPDTLMQRADIAMYEAKRRGGGVGAYERASDPFTPLRLARIAALRPALDDDEFILHFQPKIDSRSGALVGAEELVRWLHPEWGLLQPDDFLPLIEPTPLVRPFTRRVLDLSLAQCRTWRDAGQRLPIAVNLSARNLHDPSFATDVELLLDQYGLDGEDLELEITESAIMIDPDRAIATLHDLRGLGIPLTIDDFGTGYTSLSQLGQLPISTLKIDKSFVIDMIASPEHRAVVRSIVHLATSLGLKTVAEGVEEAVVAEALADLGCDYLQGYLVARALPINQFDEWVELYRPTAWPANRRHTTHAARPLSPRAEVG